MEKTLILLKPDAVQRGLVGDIISRFERKGYSLVALKLLQVPIELAEKHYIEHKDKPFFGRLVSFLVSSPVVALVVQGENVIEDARKMAGASNPSNREVGTIRFDYSCTTNYNLIHTSDSKESAEREISLYFNPSELVEYRKDIDVWIRGTE